MEPYFGLTQTTCATNTPSVSTVTFKDIEATLRAFRSIGCLEPPSDWQRLDSPYAPKTKRAWVPPANTPFVEYEKSDHAWLKKLGFGHYEDQPVVYFINRSAMWNFTNVKVFDEPPLAAPR